MAERTKAEPEGVSAASGFDHSRKAAIRLKCGEIGDVVFYHCLDRDRRDRLASELFDLTRLLTKDQPHDL